ncbi:hypothetical protein N0A02_26980 [Paraburkholderia acidicola]|uniref:Uncharacterized protein n=1 Tax=Paraburkholderia acidicola TaxID=1912599 RepID=A0ABV1LWY0_9BURK
MTQDFGKTLQGETPGRRSIPVSAALVVVILAGVLGYEVYTWHVAWSDPGRTTHTVGAHLYGELQVVESDVLSGKIKDANDPRLAAIGDEISTYENTRQNRSFEDTVLFEGLREYGAELGAIAGLDVSRLPPTVRDDDLMPLKQRKAEIEKYVN